jgi:large subunit ribosomal protein L32
MVVRMRHTRGHTGNRRSHHALTEPRLSTCKDCGAVHVRHSICPGCGKYRGKVIIDVAAMAEKAAKKAKEKKEAQASN